MSFEEFRGLIYAEEASGRISLTDGQPIDDKMLAISYACTVLYDRGQKLFTTEQLMDAVKEYCGERYYQMFVGDEDAGIEGDVREYL